MRIRAIHVGRWRNLEGVNLSLGIGNDPVCLVGESDTAKSHLLELIDFSARALGLATQSEPERPPPCAQSKPFDFEITFAIKDVLPNAHSILPARLRSIASQWNGGLTFRAWGNRRDPVDRPPDASELFVQRGASSEYWHWERVHASGIENPHRSCEVAGLLIDRLREASEMLYLQIDAERAFTEIDLHSEKLQKCLFVLDDSQGHMNTELLNNSLEYLQATIDTGQAWIAAQALEAVGVTSAGVMLALDLDEDQVVRRIAPRHKFVATSTLPRRFRSSALSLAGTGLFLIEGGLSTGNEAERFADLLDVVPSYEFVGIGGWSNVIGTLQKIRALSPADLASATGRLPIGGFIDRDFRTDMQIEELVNDTGVCVLPVHEIENFFLEPTALAAIGDCVGKNEEQIFELIQLITDRYAGHWIWRRTCEHCGWRGISGHARESGYAMTWTQLAPDPEQAIQASIDEIAALDDQARTALLADLLRCAEDYRSLRAQPEELWKQCLGKETLHHAGPLLGFQTGEDLEDRVAELWRTSAIERPLETEVLRQYADRLLVPA